jgi:ElaB/YqjD/DUF883 family membrane-anchored ribosome-binding protein
VQHHLAGEREIPSRWADFADSESTAEAAYGIGIASILLIGLRISSSARRRSIMAGKGETGSHPRMSAGYPKGSSEQSEEHKGLKESAQEMASHLSERAVEMTDRAREAVGQAGDKAREFVSGMAGQAQERWGRASEGLQEGYSHLSDRAGDIWHDATSFVRRYPLASLAVAFGLGCLASAALMAVPHATDDVAEGMSRSSS